MSPVTSTNLRWRDNLMYITITSLVMTTSVTTSESNLSKTHTIIISPQSKIESTKSPGYVCQFSLQVLVVVKF